MPALRLVLTALLAALLLAACAPDASAPVVPAAPEPAAPEPAAPEPAASPSTGASTGAAYLALGDSVAAGEGAPAGRGYVALLADLLRDRLQCDGDGASRCPLELVDLSAGGATTATLLRDQLPAAVELLRSGLDVALVTVTIGGNDVFGPVLRGCAVDPGSASCPDTVERALRAADRGVDQVLAGLAEAAGAGTTIAVMTYDDPVPACRLAALAPLSSRVLEGDGAESGLNDLLRARAAEHGAVVVETSGRLRVPADFVGGDDCLHPSASGHARTATAFDAAVGERVAGR